MASRKSSGRPQWSRLMPVESYLLPIVPDELYNLPSSANDFDPIFFQFLPTLSGDDETANYDEVGGDIIGRPEGFSIYKNSSSRTIQLQTMFAAIDEEFDVIWVQQQLHRLKALTKPIYDREDVFNKSTGAIFYAPPLCIFSYGFRYVNIPVVVQTVNYTIPEEASITPIDAFPTAVEVTITLKINYPYGYVPGYLNFSRLYNTEPLNNQRWNPGNVSWLGGRSNLPEVARDVTSNYFGRAIEQSKLRNITISDIAQEVG